jgi:hypothetical protein
MTCYGKVFPLKLLAPQKEIPSLKLIDILVDPTKTAYKILADLLGLIKTRCQCCQHSLL